MGFQRTGTLTAAYWIAQIVNSKSDYYPTSTFAYVHLQYVTTDCNIYNFLQGEKMLNLLFCAMSLILYSFHCYEEFGVAIVSEIRKFYLKRGNVYYS
jgi:hypothetical protein